MYVSVMSGCRKQIVLKSKTWGPSYYTSLKFSAVVANTVKNENKNISCSIDLQKLAAHKIFYFS